MSYIEKFIEHVYKTLLSKGSFLRRKKKEEKEEEMIRQLRR